MAAMRDKREDKKEEGTSGLTKKRGRKSGSKHMKTIIDAYIERNPLDIRAQFASWERELNNSIKHRDIPMEEWESMVLDLGNSHGTHSLFKKTIQ